MRIEESLKAGEEKYRLLFENMMDCFALHEIILNKQGKPVDYVFIEINFAFEKFMGMKRENVIGKKITEVLPGIENEPADWIGQYGKVALTFQEIRFDQYFPILEKWCSVLAFSPRKGQFATIFEDITEKKKMMAHLQQSQKMEAIGTLAGGIAHDFNNILFPIIGHTEMIMMDLPENSPFRDSLDKIYCGAMRAKDMVKQILTFSRKESSELNLIKIQPIIKEALKFIRSTIPAIIHIKQDINAECGMIKADPTQIHQIVMNLTINAYHAMEETGGELKVSLAEIEMGKHDVLIPNMEPGNYTCLTVADEGVGMDKDLRTKIFDPFFTTKGKDKGTGMGLSVVHGYC